LVNVLGKYSKFASAEAKADAIAMAKQIKDASA